MSQSRTLRSRLHPWSVGHYGLGHKNDRGEKQIPGSPRIKAEDTSGPNQEVKLQKAGFRFIMYWLSAVQTLEHCEKR